MLNGVPESWIVPDWSAPARVRALITSRHGGGASRGAYADFNLGEHVADDHVAVSANRQRLNQWLPHPPLWLDQVHGAVVAELPVQGKPTADAAVTFLPRQVCAVLTADCLPVLLARCDGSGVAAAHAGWRGLAAGVLERSCARLRRDEEVELCAYLGPAIGPLRFEVGDEVRALFVADDAAAATAFVAGSPGKWLADIYELARQRLRRAGVTLISGGGYCTVSEQRFFSYRRDGETGRMASLIWLEDVK